ncbi:hypothetical protein AB0395_47105 [Streptosporangium sp. NPDC051023]|uniref:hypothetical protein n=1 Tax=Streptosporangium sp. NPDC051023 TaxID=3155410 RepID=UPI00344F76AA
MTGLIFGVAVLVGGLLAAHPVDPAGDPNDVFADPDLVLGGRLTIALHEDAERLVSAHKRKDTRTDDPHRSDHS